MPTWVIQPLNRQAEVSTVNIRYFQYYEIPQVIPATIDFNPPELPITRTRTQSGSIVQRVWASRHGQGRLKLGFKNVSDTDAEKLATMWDRAKGRRLSIVLPSRLFKGADPALRAHLELNGLSLSWAFARQPQPRSVIPGVSSVDLEFVTRGYGGQALPVVTVPSPPRILNIDVYRLLLNIVAVAFSIKRLARLNPVEIIVNIRDILVLRSRRYSVAALVVTPALAATNVLQGRIWSVSRLSSPPALSAVILGATRIYQAGSLSASPSLTVAVLAVRRAYEVSPLVRTPALTTTGVYRTRQATVGSLGISTTLSQALVYRPDRGPNYFANWQIQNRAWRPDYLPDWWAN